MKAQNHVIAFTVFLLFTSCELFSDAELSEDHPGDENVTWVEQVFSGGRQCNPEESYEPPETQILLNVEGIQVFNTKKQQLLVCGACSCPYYAAVHYAEIPKDKVDAAKEIGFESTEDPTNR